MARLVYLGTPQAAVPPLEALVNAGHDVALVITRADKRRGRGKDLSSSPVKAAAQRLGLPVSHQVSDVVETEAELGVVVAYGALIKPDVLDQLPMVNLHFSLLPRWRGAAPVERSILAGDPQTGVCLMAVEEGLDTGGVFAHRLVDIGDDDTADELRSRLTEVGTVLLIEKLSNGASGLGQPVAQQGEATYAAKITTQELRLDFSRSALELHRLVRVGRSWTTWRGSRLGIRRSRLVPFSHDAPEIASSPSIAPPGSLVGPVVVTGDGGIELLEVQPEGKGVMGMAAWLNGARPKPAERLGS